MQSTGLWAPAQKEVTIKSNANVPVTVTVALADDLTGREKHEVALNRPPRVTKTYSLDASGTVKFKVPYGGLIYIKGNSSTNESASFTFTGVVKAPFYKDGAWKNDLNSPAPLGELESDAFVYTTPKKNLNASNYTGGLEQFANDLDTFASSMNDFYGRNETSGKHRMFTYKALTGHKHRFTNDVQISIGDAHSGYPVMNSSFSTNQHHAADDAAERLVDLARSRAQRRRNAADCSGRDRSGEQRAGAVHAGSLSRQDEPCR